jgi:hypothetical protein
LELSSVHTPQRQIRDHEFLLKLKNDHFLYRLNQSDIQKASLRTIIIENGYVLASFVAAGMRFFLDKTIQFIAASENIVESLFSLGEKYSAI